MGRPDAGAGRGRAGGDRARPGAGGCGGWSARRGGGWRAAPLQCGDPLARRPRVPAASPRSFLGLRAPRIQVRRAGMGSAMGSPACAGKGLSSAGQEARGNAGLWGAPAPLAEPGLAAQSWRGAEAGGSRAGGAGAWGREAGAGGAGPREAAGGAQRPGAGRGAGGGGAALGPSWRLGARTWVPEARSPVPEPSL